MPKKRKRRTSQRGLLSTMKSAAGMIAKSVVPPIFNTVDKEAQKLLHNAEKHILHVQEKMLKRLGASLTIFLGFIAVVVAGYYLLREEFALSNSISFVIVGAVLLIVGLILKTHYLEEDE